MKVFQTPTFERKYKKLHRNQLELINTSIERIIADPEIGIQKSGDLGTIRVYKLRKNSLEMLVAYWTTKTSIELVDFGVHENFYRDLKKRLH